MHLFSPDPFYELLRGTAGASVSQGDIGWYGGLIFSIFLVGWAAGGVLFGIVADRYGRTKTLIFTILTYALFTGLAALSTSWWELAAYRFVTALGVGGEWAAGAVLVAEVWPEDKRTRAAGILQSAWAGDEQTKQRIFGRSELCFFQCDGERFRAGNGWPTL